MNAVGVMNSRGGTLEAQSMAPLPRAVRELIRRGDRELSVARTCTDPAVAFSHAHLAALRYAGAVIAARPASSSRSRARSAWVMLAAREPRLASWSAYFSGGAATRAAVDAGRFEAVEAVDALEWIDAAERFGTEVCDVLAECGAAPHGRGVAHFIDDVPMVGLGSRIVARAS